MAAKAKVSSKTTSKVIAIYEIVHGSVDTVLGMILIFFNQSLLGWYNHFKAGELLEDPHDLFIRIADRYLPTVFQNNVLIPVIVYLVGFGLARVISGIGLLQNKEWGKHLLIGLLALFVPFDIYHLFQHISLLTLSYMIINVLIILYFMHFQPKEYFKEVKVLVKNRF